MPDHQLLVARGFRIVGGVLGVPSALAAVALGAGAVLMRAGAPAQRPDYLSVSTYGLVGLLSNAATGAGSVLSVFNGVAGWVLVLLAVLALAAALVSGLLYLVGRGLRASRPWARALGIALLALLTFNSLMALLMLRGGARLADAVMLALFAYALWVLGWRFGKRA